MFDIDLEQSPQCGGPLTIIAAIEDPPVIAKILTDVGLSAAQSSGAGLRPIPIGLIAHRAPLPSGSSCTS